MSPRYPRVTANSPARCHPKGDRVTLLFTKNLFFISKEQRTVRCSVFLSWIRIREDPGCSYQISEDLGISYLIQIIQLEVNTSCQIPEGIDGSV